LFAQLIRCDRAFARANAGNNMAARMAMMAITTSNSMSVNPLAARLYLRFMIPLWTVAAYGASDAETR
jgi:hypothetical protein